MDSCKRILVLANASVGYEVCTYLKACDEKIVGLVLHEPDRQQYAREIIEVVQCPSSCVFSAHQLRDPASLQRIAQLKPDIILSVFWAYMLKPEFYEIAPLGCINFHPGYLPYNRGKNPNVWPFVEGSPAGVTLHYVDEGVDTGDIIARREVPIEPTDTGGSLYDKTLHEIVDLFKEIWPAIKAGQAPRTPQDELQATFHLGKQVDELDRIDLDRTYKARDLLNILRARSYEDRSYAYFEDHGRRVSVRVHLEYMSNPTLQATSETTTSNGIERCITPTSNTR